MVIFEIPWEKDINDNKAIFKEIDKLKINPAFSKKIALLKLTSITLISGFFQEKQLLFYPYASILFDSSDKLEFFGLYCRELNQDSIQDKFPVICIRKSSWIKSADRKAYKKAKTSEEYVSKYLLSEQHTISNNTFLNYNDASPILVLASEIIESIKQGIQIEKCNQTEPEFEYIKYSVTDGFIDYNLNYTPFKFKSRELENWALKWREYFNQIKPDVKLNPTKRFRVSYESSILDYFSKFKPYFTRYEDHGVEPRSM